LQDKDYYKQKYNQELNSEFYSHYSLHIKENSQATAWLLFDLAYMPSSTSLAEYPGPPAKKS